VPDALLSASVIRAVQTIGIAAVFSLALLFIIWKLLTWNREDRNTWEKDMKETHLKTLEAMKANADAQTRYTEAITKHTTLLQMLYDDALRRRPGGA
jgi:hypothetical protein